LDTMIDFFEKANITPRSQVIISFKSISMAGSTISSSY
jgi:hypothetical protein